MRLLLHAIGMMRPVLVELDFSRHVETLAARYTAGHAPTTWQANPPISAMPHYGVKMRARTVRSVVGTTLQDYSKDHSEGRPRARHESISFYRCSAINSLQFTWGDAYL